VKRHWMLLFSDCESGDREEGFDKVAIYVLEDKPTHVARLWVEDRAWSSKLGEENDITHHDLDCLEGKEYGRVARILKRQRRS
jgi:hypothetical protein